MASSAIDMLGFVGVHEVQNTFAKHLEKIDVYININGNKDAKTCLFSKAELFDMLDDLRQDLIHRARGNLMEYLRNNPHIREQMRDERMAEQVQETKMDWRDRVKANRERAAKGEE